jgi:hypothetical protein
LCENNFVHVIVRIIGETIFLFGSAIFLIIRVLAWIKFRRPKKHVATTMTRCLGEIFLVNCQKQAFSFNKREAKVYCYAFLHVLKRDACIKHEKTILNFFGFWRENNIVHIKVEIISISC